MGSLHEGGHALYGQGFDPADERTPLAEGISLGIHESQSRMWENMVGRSRAFWNHYTPLLAKTFPENMEGVTPEQVYRTLNRVQPSLIRVEADECTYNLHIVIRFEIEVALVEGTLSLDDLPGAWNAKVRDYLGIEVPDDARGCLQDIHWAHGSMGYFPTYALGNVYAAQLFERVLQDLPGLWDQVGRGEFTPLREWLRDHVHRVGRRKLPEELLQDVTGSGPTVEPYLNYLETKFGEVYGLTPAP
jgi:carboxypeptidase Taq